MAEYIKREAALNAIDHAYSLSSAYDFVAGIPAADVAPVVHGKWEIIDHYPYPETIRCSVCGREFGGNTDWIRCPLCEARMEGELCETWIQI